MTLVAINVIVFLAEFVTGGPVLNGGGGVVGVDDPLWLERAGHIPPAFAEEDVAGAADDNGVRRGVVVEVGQ